MLSILSKAALAALLVIAPAAANALTAATGVYRGAGCTGRDRMAPFTKMLGRKPAMVTEFAENSNWTNMLNSVTWSAKCWNGAYRMVQSVPMLMSTGTLAEGAQGANDAHFVALGKTLVANKQPNAIIRIGWEFNGDWYRWAAANDPVAFIAYYRRIVAAMRSVPGQQFKFVWNPALGLQKIAAELVYPGNDVVDFIGFDVYNQSWRPQDTTPELRWQGLLTQTNGLNWVASFAASKGKWIALPEWGTGTRPDGHGGGDDPLFIANMGKWIAGNRVIFQNYWDYAAPDFNGELSNGAQPNSGLAYQAAFGTPPLNSGAAGLALSAVPEPRTWALLIGGFGAIGLMARRRRATTAPSAGAVPG